MLSAAKHLASVFAALKERDELALIPYLTAGFPSLPAFLDHLRRVADAGADLIEIGVPFSDPIADGPTIQYASQVALSGGARLPAILDALAGVRIAPPLVAMSYLNPLLALEGRASSSKPLPDGRGSVQKTSPRGRGSVQKTSPRGRGSEGRDGGSVQSALGALRGAGICGVIIPDLPADEADLWRGVADAPARGDAASRDTSRAVGEEHERPAIIQLAAPTSSDERLRRIGRTSEGFVYAVSLTGTTGARRKLPQELPGFLARLRAATDKPVAVGFGISTPEHVRALRALAYGPPSDLRRDRARRGDERDANPRIVDGVVVGSRLVAAIRDGEDVGALVRELKRATLP